MPLMPLMNDFTDLERLFRQSLAGQTLSAGATAVRQWIHGSQVIVHTRRRFAIARQFPLVQQIQLVSALAVALFTTHAALTFAVPLQAAPGISRLVWFAGMAIALGVYFNAQNVAAAFVSRKARQGDRL